MGLIPARWKGAFPTCSVRRWSEEQPRPRAVVQGGAEVDDEQSRESAGHDQAKKPPQRDSVDRIDLLLVAFVWALGLS